MDVLVVDGYNVIGTWEALERMKQKDIELARIRLLEILSEYQAFTGYRVIVVFDALYVKGRQARKVKNNVEIVYTQEEETADEYIERLVPKLKNIKNQVYVATSDYMEQRTIFSRGALRISARELLAEINNMDREVEAQLSKHARSQPKHKIQLNDQVLKQFEKWRRNH